MDNNYRFQETTVEMMTNPKIAVLIPCYNEHSTIVKVIQDFQRELPGADIFVFDNNSTDGSLELARNTAATVIREKHQGKGFVISSMIKTVIADYYVMVDADDTYPAERVHDLLQPLFNEEADMVVGQRLSDFGEKAFRPLHYSGNKLVCSMINLVFSSHLKDPMSGYRSFTRDVARELPIVATGFDVETEMTLQLLYRHFAIREIEIAYRERPSGSYSKLNTFKDGWMVLWKIFSIIQSYKPLTFFGGMGMVLFIIGLIMGGLVIRDFTLYGRVVSIINPILAVGFATVGVISTTIGIMLHDLNFRLLEISSIESRMFHHIDQLYRRQ